MSVKECEKKVFKSFFEFKKEMFPNLLKKEQESKKFTKKSWGYDLWKLFEEGFKDFN